MDAAEIMRLPGRTLSSPVTTRFTIHKALGRKFWAWSDDRIPQATSAPQVSDQSLAELEIGKTPSTLLAVKNQLFWAVDPLLEGVYAFETWCPKKVPTSHLCNWKCVPILFAFPMHCRREVYITIPQP